MSKEVQVYDDYAQKVADICHVPYVAVVALRDQGCLNVVAVRDCVIRHDYWALINTNKLTKRQVIARLAGIYGVAESTIESTVRKTKWHRCFCRECGASMVKRKFVTNGGLCDRCLANHINT